MHDIRGIGLVDDFVSAVAKNIAANYVGSAWSAVMAIAFIPLYVRYLGMEAYGLIGAFASLLAVFALLDAGLSTTINRELAALSAKPDGAAGMRTLVRTLEVVYWGIGALIFVVLMFAAPLATSWVNTEKLSTSEVVTAARISGAAFALQWPLSLYMGGLYGLQRQVDVNIASAVTATVRGGGAVLVLLFVAPTVEAYFVWQGIASAANTVVLAVMLWRNLPKGGEARFDRAVLRRVHRFAAGMSATATIGVIITQADKWVLSKLLPLEAFGYYALASVVAGNLSRLTTPITTAVFPKMVQLAAAGSDEDQARIYHRSTQTMCAITFPVALTICLYSPSVLRAWTSSVDVERTAPLVSILIVGTFLNAIYGVAYTLQLAHGWTSLSITVNTLLAPCVVLGLVLVTGRFGTEGASVVVSLYHLATMTLTLTLMHRRLLPGHQSTLYLRDLAPVMAGGALPILLGRLVPWASMSRPLVALTLGVLASAGVATASLAAADLRGIVLSRARSFVAARARRDA